MSRLTPVHLSRRRALGALTTVAGAALAGCASSPTSPSSTSTTTTASSTTTTAGGGTTTGGNASTGTCVNTPSETEGPYPDRLGMINTETYYRRDITEGRPGTPLALTLTIVNASSGCAPIANAVVEIWQCDHTGVYSEYGTAPNQTFLRGLQRTDSNGRATFQTIYPGWYQGRATHIHVEIFVNNRSVKVTQVAFPESESAVVYAQGVYAARGQNSTTNARDNVFSDGVQYQLASLGGSPSGGYTGTLTIGVPA